MIVGLPALSCCCDPPGPPPPGNCSPLNGTCTAFPGVDAVQLNVSNWRKIEYRQLGFGLCVVFVVEWDYSVTMHRTGQCTSLSGSPWGHADAPTVYQTGPAGGPPCFNEPKAAARIKSLWDPCATGDWPDLQCGRLGANFKSDFGWPGFTAQWFESVPDPDDPGFCMQVTESQYFPPTEAPRVSGTATRYLLSGTNIVATHTKAISMPLRASMVCEATPANSPFACEFGTFMHIQLRWVPESFAILDPTLFPSYNQMVADALITFPEANDPPLGPDGNSVWPGFSGGFDDTFPTGFQHPRNQINLVAPVQSGGFPQFVRGRLYKCNPNVASSPCRQPWGTTGCNGEVPLCTAFPGQNGFQRPCGFINQPFGSWVCYTEPQFEMEAIAPT